MAKLNLYRTEEDIGRRQLPITSDNLMMLMDLNGRGLAIDSPTIRGRELEEFTRKFNLLTHTELREALEIDSPTFLSVLNQCVQCVGCRRRVERLFCQLTHSGHPTLEPLVFQDSCTLTLTEEKLLSPQALGTVLYRHHEILNNVLENKLRNKTRCVMHSMDAFRAKPFSETWREVWASMKYNCRDELAVIETKELYEVLQNYLKKHKFCHGCREKIEKAYKILVGDTNARDKGFVAALYANIKKCHPDKHIHVVTTKIEFLDALIRRAEPEVNGSCSKQRERHAKTLEIAQEEVLTCVGMILYERLRRIYVSLREEERACQVLAAVGVHALCRSFDMAVEEKQGISNLELLYQEISRAEKAKEIKREQKKLKKKKKKDEKKNSHRSCESSSSNVDIDDEPDEAVDVSEDHNDVEESPTPNECDKTPHANQFRAGSVEKVKTQPKQTQSKKKNKKKKQPAAISKMHAITLPDIEMTGKCEDCHEATPDCPCDVKDSGYGSEPNSQISSVISSPDGSEVSCSDGFCNHDHGAAGTDLDDEHSLSNCDGMECLSPLCARQRMSLEQMLEDFSEYDDDEENCYIPHEVVLKYQCQSETVQKQRQQLRETLKMNFARLCIQKGVSVPHFK